MFPSDPRSLERPVGTSEEQPYFEVLVVESMTEAQERALRNQLARMR